MPVVSIVIPCYNAGPLLEEAIESALSQTHREVEIVVVDDGSTDAQTVALLDRSHWSRTRILRQTNKGPAAARNTAIRAAVGAYILPLDADDRIDPTYVAKALQAMESRPGVGIVYCKALRFGRETGPWNLPKYSIQEMVIDNVIFCTALFRKSDWEAVGGFNEALRHGVEDYEFWLRLLARGVDVHQLDEYLFYYRVQEISRTSRFLQDRSGVVSTYAQIFRDNREFFARHADVLYEHRFRLYGELEQMQRKVAKLERVDRMLRRFPLLFKVSRAIYRRI